MNTPPAGLIKIPPSPFIAPEPERVPDVSVNSPLAVMSPEPVNVPPLIVRLEVVVDAVAMESEPPEIVKGSVDVKLLMESEVASECTTSAGMLIVTSSVDPGTLFVSQFVGVSQLLSPATPVHVTLESNVLGSIHSSFGRHDCDRLTFSFRRTTTGRLNIATASK